MQYNNNNNDNSQQHNNILYFLQFQAWISQIKLFWGFQLHNLGLFSLICFIVYVN